ncbi:MAG TPA: hypothetical protein DCG57_08750 [Candidatus Riflebacteria bacterium]|nr:hypothetical protein [Candidatus Riflebacteria bacterium]
MSCGDFDWRCLAVASDIKETTNKTTTMAKAIKLLLLWCLIGLPPYCYTHILIRDTNNRTKIQNKGELALPCFEIMTDNNQMRKGTAFFLLYVFAQRFF